MSISMTVRATSNNCARKGLYTICFANSTNKNIQDPRAQSWEHVYRLVTEWAAKR